MLEVHCSFIKIRHLVVVFLAPHPAFLLHDHDDGAALSTFLELSAARQLFFHVSASLQALSHSCFNFSLLVVSSAMACSVSSFSSVHFSIFVASFSFSCCMYCTARCRIDPLFFSQPGTIFANSLIPSFMVSRRRRSTEKMC